MFEQPQAQVRHHPLTDKSQHVSAHQVKGALGGEDGDQDERDAIEQLPVVALEDGIDQEL